MKRSMHLLRPSVFPIQARLSIFFALEPKPIARFELRVRVKAAPVLSRGRASAITAALFVFSSPHFRVHARLTAHTLTRAPCTDWLSQVAEYAVAEAP